MSASKDRPAVKDYDGDRLRSKMGANLAEFSATLAKEGETSQPFRFHPFSFDEEVDVTLVSGHQRRGAQLGGGHAKRLQNSDKVDRMAEITREELDLKLRLVEERMDHRVQRIEDVVERIAQEARDAREQSRSLISEVMSENRRSAEKLRDQVQEDARKLGQSAEQIRRELGAEVRQATVELERETRSTKMSIITTIIGTALAVVALVYAMQGNTLSAFQAGLGVRGQAAETASHPAATPRAFSAPAPASSASLQKPAPTASAKP